MDQTPCARKMSTDAFLIVEKFSDDVAAQGSEVVTEPAEHQAQPVNQHPERWLQRVCDRVENPHHQGQLPGGRMFIFIMQPSPQKKLRENSM